MAESHQSARDPAERPARATQSQYATENDVTKEEYKGAGVVVTSLGYITSVHLATTFIAVAIGAGLGALFHKNVNNAVLSLQLRADRWSKGGGMAKRFGKTLHWLFGYTDGVYTRLANNPAIMDHVPETVTAANGQAVKVKKNLQELLLAKDYGIFRSFSQGIVEWFSGARDVAGKLIGRNIGTATQHVLSNELTRGDAAVMSGGILGATTWVAAWFWGFIRGSKTSASGHAQFERAKNEILETREHYETLRDKYMQTRMELEDLRTLRGVDSGRLTISKDDPPPTRTRDRAAAETPSAMVSAVTREAALAAAPTKEMASS